MLASWRTMKESDFVWLPSLQLEAQTDIPPTVI